ncbi:MAG: MGMT family protein [Candidatus Micrarchaeia archaeon]
MKRRETVFEKKVYAITRRIRRGEVTNYRAIAIAIGNPKAYRAVGNALNRNSSPTIPCHRVVRSDMSVGGFNKGTVRKIALLRSEGVSICNGRVIGWRSGNNLKRTQ